MNIHEFQAKEILKRFGVLVPRSIVAATPEETKKAAQELGGGVCVVKAQIHAGGRGKGGGVKVVKSPNEAAASASDMLGKNLVTHQTSIRAPRSPGFGRAGAGTRAASFISPWWLESGAIPRYCDLLLGGRCLDRRGRRRTPGEDSQRNDRPGGRLDGISMPARGFRFRDSGATHRQVRSASCRGSTGRLTSAMRPWRRSIH